MPEVLRNGHHAEIAKWRREAALRLTMQRRPELLRALSAEDEALLRTIRDEEE